VFLHAEADDLDELIGQDKIEMMPVDTVLLGTRPKFGFEAAKDGFEVGENGEGPPHRFGVPGGFVTARQ
jgi:hypothetical protein